jgi:hypothetical protein
LASENDALLNRFGGRWSGATSSGAIPRQLLRLPLVGRPRVVNAAQDAAVDQVSRGLFNFAIAFFAAGHRGRFAP